MASSDRRILPGGFNTSSRPPGYISAVVSLFTIAIILLCIGTAAGAVLFPKTPNSSSTVLNLTDNLGGAIDPYTGIKDAGENQTGVQTASSLQYGGTVTFASGIIDTELESNIISALTASQSKFAGSALAASGYEVVVFDLITDEDLAESRYAGRPHGLKITLTYNDTLDKVQDTVWGHEFDATRIVQEFYNGDLKDEIGFVAIFYRFSGEEQWRVKLILEAQDAARFDGNWNDEDYIQQIDWTQSDFGKEGTIAVYEEPSTRMESNEGLLTASSDTITITRQLSTEELQNEMFGITSKLTELVNEIATESNNRDYSAVTSSAQELAEYATEVYEEMSTSEVPESCREIQQLFLTGITDYQRAASAYWFGAAMTNADKFGEGNELVKSGMSTLNNALGSMGLKELEVDEYILPSSDLYPEALELNEAFKYMDSKEANDISVNVESTTYREGYTMELDDGTTERVTAGYGNKFIMAIVDVTHLGYRGGGGETIKTPQPGKFVLIYEGEEYEQSTPSNFIRSVGFPYKQITLDRKEHYEGALVFEVPEDFTTENAYIIMDLDALGTGTWRLG